MRGRLIRLVGSAATVAATLVSALGCGEERASGTTGPEVVAASASSGLVECPTNQTLRASRVIGPLGGIVSVAGTSIDIPAGALSLPRLITLTAPAGKYVEVDVRADQLLSLVFDAPVTVTIDYSRCTRSDIDQAPLRAWYIDHVTKRFLEDMGGTDDKARRTVTFTTPHLSAYAVAF